MDFYSIRKGCWVRKAKDGEAAQSRVNKKGETVSEVISDGMKDITSIGQFKARDNQFTNDREFVFLMRSQNGDFTLTLQSDSGEAATLARILKKNGNIAMQLNPYAFTPDDAKYEQRGFSAKDMNGAKLEKESNDWIPKVEYVPVGNKNVRNPTLRVQFLEGFFTTSLPSSPTHSEPSAQPSATQTPAQPATAPPANVQQAKELFDNAGMQTVPDTSDDLPF